jgi:uncharacterized membrane protein YhaH (DUF805 family)
MFKLNPFKGRITRTQYLVYKIIGIFVLCSSSILLEKLGTSIEKYPIPFWLFLFYFIIISVRRAHDAGISGWWILIPIYPALLVFWSPDNGSNEYGDNPRNNKEL